MPVLTNVEVLFATTCVILQTSKRIDANQLNESLLHCAVEGLASIPVAQNTSASQLVGISVTFSQSRSLLCTALTKLKLQQHFGSDVGTPGSLDLTVKLEKE